MIALGTKILFTMTNRSLLSANYFIWLFKSKLFISYYHFSDSDSLLFLHDHMDEWSQKCCVQLIPPI